MFYSDLVKKAMTICFNAHKNDLDKGGYPYVFHPFYLASKMKGEKSTCVALLHDVIEDHGNEYSFESLEKEGFNRKIIETLKTLTHDKKVPYMDYIKEISTNNLAVLVKIEDLKHNMNLDRIKNTNNKIELYKEAYDFLTNSKFQEERRQLRYKKLGKLLNRKIEDDFNNYLFISDVDYIKARKDLEKNWVDESYYKSEIKKLEKIYSMEGEDELPKNFY